MFEGVKVASTQQQHPNIMTVSLPTHRARWGIIWLQSPKHEAAQTCDRTAAAGLGRYSGTHRNTATEHTHTRTAGNEMKQAGNNRMETSTLPLLQQHQSDAGRQATVGRTWGMGWRWACRIREVVEDALAGWLKVKNRVHPIWWGWTSVQPGLEGGFYPRAGWE